MNQSVNAGPHEMDSGDLALVIVHLEFVDKLQEKVVCLCQIRLRNLELMDQVQCM